MNDKIPPIRIDSLLPCPKCNLTVKHQRTVYVDVEYRTCTRCGHHSTWAPVPEEKFLIKIASSDPDKTKKDYDNRRRFPKRKNRTKKTDEEEDQ